MPGTDKREAAYAQARSDLMQRLLDRGAVEMDEHERGEQVREVVRELQREYPDLDDQMTRRLTGEGMQRNWGDMRTNEMTREGTAREGATREE